VERIEATPNSTESEELLQKSAEWLLDLSSKAKNNKINKHKEIEKTSNVLKPFGYFIENNRECHEIRGFLN